MCALEPHVQLVGVQSDALWFLRSPGEQPPSTALDTGREEMIERVPGTLVGGALENMEATLTHVRLHPD